MDAVHGRRVRAAALARVLVDVDPAAVQRLAQLALVLRTERRDRRRQPLEHVVVRILPIDVHQRNRRVVGVIRVEAQHLLSQPVVAAQRLDVGLGRLDQVLDDRRRDVVAVQRRLERRAEPARLRVKPVALQDRVVERRVGVDAAGIQLVERTPRERAVGLIAIGREERPVLSVRHRHVGAGGQPDGRVLDVGRRERRVRVVAASTRTGSRATAGARPCRRARAPAGGRGPRSRTGRPPGPGCLRHPLPGPSPAESASSSGSNQENACAVLGEQDLHLLPPGVELVVALILVVARATCSTRPCARAGRSRRAAGRPPAGGRRPGPACPGTRRTRRSCGRARRTRAATRSSRGRCARDPT